MEIKVNGEARTVDEGQTLGQLLRDLKIENRNLAIEHNGDFLEPSVVEAIALKPGDRLEIVRFVGGG